MVNFAEMGLGGRRLGGTCSMSLNHSYIALTPKINSPSSLHQFILISLCNFNYKIISKILTNRLKTFMHKIIGPIQFAFIKGRNIHDNSIVAHEIEKWERGTDGSET